MILARKEKKTEMTPKSEPIGLRVWEYLGCVLFLFTYKSKERRPLLNATYSR